jgi:hypothetical protein
MDLLRTSLALALTSLAAWAGPKNAILIDRSGSMRPYYQDQTVQRLSDTLVQALQYQGSTAIFTFSDQTKAVKQLDEIERLPFGGSTLLDKALEHAEKLGAKVVWMITDNIQDSPGSAEAGNTEQFYKKLRSDAVDRVTIFPLRQPPGRPGLVVYALMMKAGNADLYETGLKAFRERAVGVLRTDALRMKPLDKDTVGISWVRANVNPRTSLITYSTGKPVKELIEIKFKSKFDHIEIADSSIEVARGEPSFGKDSLVYPEKRNIDISPRTVKNLGPGDETEQVYKIDVDLGAIRLRHDPVSLWKAAWNRSSEDATLQLAFIIRVPQRNFRLRRKFLDDFDAATLQDAKYTGKVYAINQLPSLMSEAVTEVQVKSPVVFRVRYPSYPTFLWLTVFALGAAAFVGILVAAKRGASFLIRSSWEVAARTQAGAPLDSTVNEGTVFVQRDTVGRVHNGAFLPAAGVRIVHPSGAQVALADGLEVTLDASRRLIVLTFKSKKHVPTATTTAAAPPRRR